MTSGGVEGLQSYYPTKINAKGQVVGFCGETSSGVKHAFMWENGVMTDLGLGVARDINDKGVVTGDMWGVDGIHAFVWQNGVMTDLGTLGGERGQQIESFASAINSRSQVVGMTSTPSGSRAFLWENGAMIDLGTLPSGSGSGAVAINDKAQVAVASYMSSGSTRAFIWQDGVMTDLGVFPDRSSSNPTNINNNGQVVGNTFDHLTPGPMLAFIWQNGVMTELKGIPGFEVETCALDINNNGDVVGYAGASPGGLAHATLWSTR